MSKMVAFTNNFSGHLLKLFIKTGMTGNAHAQEIAQLFNLAYAQRLGLVISDFLTEFLKANFGTIVTLIVAFVPVFVTIVTLISSRTGKIKAPLDSQITVRTIKRFAVNEAMWKELSLLELRRAMLVVLLSLLIIGILLIFQDLINLAIIILLIFLLILVVSKTLVNFVISPYKYRCKDFQAAKYYVFQDASIIVDGKMEYLFAKAQEAVLGKHIKFIEVDSDNQEIQAYHDGNIITTQGTISIKFQQESPEPECTHYSIKINFIPATHGLISLFAQIIPGLSTSFTHFSTFLATRSLPLNLAWVFRSPEEDAEVKRIEAQSKIINHFLNNFLSSTTAK